MNKKINIVLFSGDYDKALASLIIANSARQMDIDVTMFFAFWGLFLLRDPRKTTFEDKSTFEKLMTLMTPEGPEELPLSKMNLSGLGKKMLQGMMKDHDAPELIDFLNGARKKGVKFYGCKLSVEVMGFKEHELIPELEIVDAQEYLKDAITSEMQLFI